MIMAGYYCFPFLLYARLKKGCIMLRGMASVRPFVNFFVSD